MDLLQHDTCCIWTDVHYNSGVIIVSITNLDSVIKILPAAAARFFSRSLSFCWKITVCGHSSSGDYSTREHDELGPLYFRIVIGLSEMSELADV